MIFVEIQSRHIEFYSANLVISAHLSGIRYWMFYWPFLSAFVGVGSILFFITLVCTLSYLHFANEVENMDESNEKNDLEEENDVKSDSDCKSHFTICQIYLYNFYINIIKKSSFKVSHILQQISKMKRKVPKKKSLLRKVIFRNFLHQVVIVNMKTIINILCKDNV